MPFLLMLNVYSTCSPMGEGSSSKIMSAEINIEERKPIWIALSNLYIDTELQDNDFKSIARTINDSPYSFEKIKQIDKAEVFPILRYNLLNVSGVWTGFQEDWLVKEISKKLQNRNFVGRLLNSFKYLFFGKMNKVYWQQIESQLKD